jgi:hypothetical protein
VGFVGDIAKAILILTMVCWLYAIIEFVDGQYALALFLFIGLLVPSSIVFMNYRKSKKSVR